MFAALALISLSTTQSVLAADPTNACVISASTQTNGFEFVVGTTNASFTPTQNVALFVFLKNTATNTRTIRIDDGFTDYSFVVINPDGKAATVSELGNRLFAPAAFFHQSCEEIQPNQLWRESIPLNKLFVMTNAGKYQITTKRTLSSGESISAGPIVVRIKRPE